MYIFFTLALLPLFLSIEATRCQLNPSIYNFKLGNIRGTILSDGEGIFEDNAYSVPDRVVRKSYRASYRSAFPFIVQQNIAVLDVRGRRIMVDTGSVNVPEFPQFRNGGQLMSNLKAAGIPPDSIDMVFLTHAHSDHVSGLLNRNGTAAFPNAHVYIGKTEHQFWSTRPVENPNPNIPKAVIDALADIYVRSIRPYKGRLRIVRENGSPFAGITFISTPGHSPGHNAIKVSSAGKTLIISGDSWGGKPNQVRNPEWSFFVETNAKDALASRLRILEMAARRRFLVLAYHEEFPGLGYISKSRGRFDWISAPFQSLGYGIRKQC